MIYYYFIKNDWSTVMTSFGILIALGFILMLAVGIDLAYGIAGSKKQGEYTHSNGLRMTTSKLTSYYSLLLVGFFLDSVNPMFFYWKIHYLPIMSILITIYFLITEYISIKEHLSNGMRKKMRNTPGEVREILKEFKDIAKDIKDIKDLNK